MWTFYYGPLRVSIRPNFCQGLGSLWPWTQSPNITQFLPRQLSIAEKRACKQIILFHCSYVLKITTKKNVKNRPCNFFVIVDGQFTKLNCHLISFNLGGGGFVRGLWGRRGAWWKIHALCNKPHRCNKLVFNILFKLPDHAGFGLPGNENPLDLWNLQSLVWRHAMGAVPRGCHHQKDVRQALEKGKHVSWFFQ